MNRNKFTDFIFDKMKWTGIFLYDQIYGERLSTILDEMKGIKNWNTLLIGNDDVLSDVIINRNKIEVIIKT